MTNSSEADLPLHAEGAPEEYLLPGKLFDPHGLTVLMATKDLDYVVTTAIMETVGALTLGKLPGFHFGEPINVAVRGKPDTFPWGEYADQYERQYGVPGIDLTRVFDADSTLPTDVGFMVWDDIPLGALITGPVTLRTTGGTAEFIGPAITPIPAQLRTVPKFGYARNERPWRYPYDVRQADVLLKAASRVYEMWPGHAEGYFTFNRIKGDDPSWHQP
jgi:hypothetical protein